MSEAHIATNYLSAVSIKVGGRCEFIGDCDSSRTKNLPHTDI